MLVDGGAKRIQVVIALHETDGTSYRAAGAIMGCWRSLGALWWIRITSKAKHRRCEQTKSPHRHKRVLSGRFPLHLPCTLILVSVVLR